LTAPVDDMGRSARLSPICDTAEGWSMHRNGRCGNGIRVFTGWRTGLFGYGCSFWHRVL
jgi:hypothetical protein